MSGTESKVSARDQRSRFVSARRIRLEGLLVGLLIGCFAIWRKAIVTDAKVGDNDLGILLLVAGVSTAASLSAARRTSGRSAGAWRLIATSLAIWVAFGAWVFFADALKRNHPSAEIAQSLALVAMMPALSVGLLLFPRHPASSGVLRQFRRDLIPAIVALATTSWLLVVGPVLAAPHADLAVRVSAVAHGIASVGLMATILAVLLIDGRPAPPCLRTFALSACLLVVGDAIWLRSWAEGATPASALADASFFAGFALIGYAARRSLVWRRDDFGFRDGIDKPAWHEQVANLSLVLLLTMAGIQEASGDITAGGVDITIIASLAVLWFVIARSAFAFHNARRLKTEIGQLSTRLDGLIQEVGRDPLTGLVNRRLIHERIDQELTRARESGQPLAVALIDLDNFKQINDSLGHDAGDRVICTVASILSASCRAGDVAARYAGDEFVLLLPGLSEADAAAVCERVIAELRERKIELAIGKETHFGLSIGVAVTRSARRSAEHMLRVADASMYDAKSAGKNCYDIVDADTLIPLNRDFAADFPKLSTAFVYRLGDRRGQRAAERVLG